MAGLADQPVVCTGGPLEVHTVSDLGRKGAAAETIPNRWFLLPLAAYDP